MSIFAVEIWKSSGPYPGILCEGLFDFFPDNELFLRGNFGVYLSIFLVLNLGNCLSFFCRKLLRFLSSLSVLGSSGSSDGAMNTVPSPRYRLCRCSMSSHSWQHERVWISSLHTQLSALKSTCGATEGKGHTEVYTRIASERRTKNCKSSLYNPSHHH